jgi:hypothetical protein
MQMRAQPPPGRVRVSWMRWDPARGSAVVYASKLAAASGMHMYVGRDDLRGELLRALGRPDHASFKTTTEVAVDALAALSPQKKAALDRELSVSHGDAVKAVEAADRAVEQVINQVSDPRTARAVQQHLISTVFTRHGTEKECSVLQSCGGVNTSNAFLTSKKPAFSLSNGTRVHVGGRIDGERGGGEILEVKTRQRRLLGVPLYERIQLHAYMFALGKRTSTLVEAYLSETAEHSVEFDDTLWEQVCLGAKETLEACIASRNG